jgi:hypothetical protein
MIKLQTLDRKIWRRDLLLVYLYDCYNKNVNAVIDFGPEGSCAGALGLYRLLNEFCANTGYVKNRITIMTANMLEHHAEYIINKQPKYWYEINSIQTWLQDKNLSITYTPPKHFANFISRSNWYRLWTATILDKYYRDKTIQTYHYDPNKENYNVNGYVGVDDLIKYKCDIVTAAVEFIKTCPRTLDIKFLQDLNNCKDSIYQHENSYYPIQHPSNLNLLQYYNDIFVDIVVETNISGNCFLVTEKLWRCVVARRPFIVVSNADYLKNLRRLGFKTFDAWWNEEYDMYSLDSRIKHIEQLLMIISAWDQDKLFSILQEMYGILEHNYQTFLNLNINQIKDIFDV